MPTTVGLRRVRMRTMRPERRGLPSAPGRPGGFVDEDLVALHGAVELVGGDEEVVVTAGAGGVGADEAEAVAVEVELAGDEVVAGRALRASPGLRGETWGTRFAGGAGGFFRGALGEGPLARCRA